MMGCVPQCLLCPAFPPSGVSLLNQAGPKTWPITSVPFLMLRVDATSRGANGKTTASSRLLHGLPTGPLHKCSYPPCL